MASNKLIGTIMVLYLFACLTFIEANCPPPTTTPTPKPTPPTTKPPPYVPPTPTPPTTTTPSPPSQKCPKDTLKLGACADLLGLVNIIIGTPPSGNCCALINGLVDLEAALCLCTAIKANVIGINLNVPVTLSLILSACQKNVPSGFQCP
ncbi:hypothetical protein Lal_00020400 [Lupinus albus]|uniref:Putative bifunctional inhibitor/plant lipid transfer protein/seed storage helical n=1 Tax=Lupinus albus TaxID=3870 RepID=A0A6A4Q6W1_LUPAL|nr:putative bifunctional inhibitor/plant lipid transfer protein/seed storage helical [Lupinus albus]KAF1871606.1 hypothetical protein Lal_00020400 [Lupinus albus]